MEEPFNGYALHYNQPNLFDSDSEDEDESYYTTKITETKDKSNNDANEVNASKIHENRYQGLEECIFTHTDL